MPVKRLLLFSPDDVHAIRLTCKKCGMNATAAFAKRKLERVASPCGCDWDSAATPTPRDYAVQLHEALRALQHAPDAPFTIQLEVTE